MRSTGESSAAPALCGVVRVAGPPDGIEKALDSLGWATTRCVVLLAGADEEDVRAALAASDVPLLRPPAARPTDALAALEAAGETAPWVLLLDADEHLADDAAEEAARLIALAGADHDAVALPRHTRIGTEPLRQEPGYPDRRLRLLRRGAASVEGGRVRLVRGEEAVLVPPLPCLHIHHRGHATLAAWIEDRLGRWRAPGDGEDGGAAAFAEARAAARRAADATAPGGELERALACVAAWEATLEGLVQWHATAPAHRPPLAPPLPPVPQAGSPGGLRAWWRARRRRRRARRRP